MIDVQTYGKLMNKKDKRVYLSPHMSGKEIKYIEEALPATGLPLGAAGGCLRIRDG